RHIAAPYLERGELIQLPGPTLKARFSYYVVHPAHRRPTAAAATFINWPRRRLERRLLPAVGQREKPASDRDAVLLQRPGPRACDLAVDHDRRIENAVTGIGTSGHFARHDGAAILIRDRVLVVRGQEMAA